MKVIISSLFLPSSILFTDSKNPKIHPPTSPLYLNLSTKPHEHEPNLQTNSTKNNKEEEASVKHNVKENPSNEITLTAMKSGNIGLVNAVDSIDHEVLPRVWIGSFDSPIQPDLYPQIKNRLNEKHQVPVFLTEDELEGHYNQFCKQILWKTFHYQFPADARSCTNERLAWKKYEAVNYKFALAIVQEYSKGDIIWINDYHLMLVPSMVRKMLPNAAIGFFLHIPFPSSEIFRCLYVRNQILLGILGADLIGFQTYSFMRHFLMNCTRLLSLESTPKGIQLDNTLVSCGIFPIGINLIALNKKRNDPQVPEMISLLQEKYLGKKLIIGRDKNDYVKGVRLKMLAFERFLYCHPEWIGKVVLIQVALSTAEANENECMVSDVVARINSKFGSIEYHPVVYLHQDISFSHYLALLTIADACLITSLRDGMNLTSHEYVVCQESKHSPLIMSEFAGTYGSFGCALRVNPWDKQEVADAIHESLMMTEEEKYNRWKELYRNVMCNTAQNYVQHFTSEILNVHEEHYESKSTHIPLLNDQDVCMDYMASHKRLFLINDQGTLSVNESQLDLVKKLTLDPRNLVYLMSGKTKVECQVYKDIQGLGISAENGSFIKFNDRQNWVPISQNVDLTWKKDILDILEFYTDRTPGSYIEVKEMGLVWHIGIADYNFGKWQAAECMNHIQNSGYYSIHTLASNKSLQIMPKNIHKGMAVRRIIEHHQGRRLSAHFMNSACSFVACQYHNHNHTRSVHLPLTSLSNDLSATLTTTSVSMTTSTTMSNTITTTFPSTDTTTNLTLMTSLNINEKDSPSSPESSSYYMTSPQSRSISPTHYLGKKSMIDFIICIGDDRQDEYMFEYLLKEDSMGLCQDSSPPSPLLNEEIGVLGEQSRSLRSIWTCTIGEKSSAAKWHLSGPSHVVSLLNRLSTSDSNEF